MPRSAKLGKRKKHCLFLNRFVAFLFFIHRPKKRVLNLSPVNWISNYFMSIGGPIVGDTKVQSSIPDDYDHIIYMINKYKVSSLLPTTSVFKNFITK